MPHATLLEFSATSLPMRFSYLFHEPIATIDELEKCAEFVATQGYKGIELSASHPAPYTAQAAREVAQRHGLEIPSVLSGWSYPNEGLCLSSPDAAIRDRAVERLVEYAQWAHDAGALMVVGLMQGRRTDEPDEEKANGRIAEALNRVCAAAEPIGTPIVLEPVNHLQVGFNHTAAAAVALVERVGSPAMGFMLDTFHMNIEEHGVLDALRRYAPTARHFHLCETTGGLFGGGSLDFRRVLIALQTADYHHWVSVKNYRTADWREAARGAAVFLKQFGCF